MSDNNDEDFDDFLDEAEQALNDGEIDEAEQERRERAARVNEGLRTGSNTDNPLGHVIASQDLRIGRHENDIRVYIHSDTRNNVRLGDYVLLPYPEPDSDRSHAELFGVVTGMRYAHRTEVNDTEDLKGGLDDGGVDERRYTLVAEVDPISAIHGTEETSLKSRTVDMIPKPSTYMYPADNEDYLRTGLNIPEEGPFIGYMAVSGEERPRDSPLPFKMPDDDESGEPAIFRHTLVGGSTGKGKTHFTKNILRQYATSDRRYQIKVQNPEDGTGNDDNTQRRRLTSLIIDPENEYTELANDNPELFDNDGELDKDTPIGELIDDRPVSVLEDQTLRDLEQRGIEVGGINDSSDGNDLRTYIPDVAGTSTPDVDDSYEFTIPFSFVQDHYQLMMPFEPPEPTRQALRKSIRTYFNNNDEDDSGTTYEDFIKFMKKGQEWLAEKDPYQTIAPHRGEWVEDHTFEESILDAVVRRVDSPAYVDIFDNGATPLGEASKEMFDPGRTTIVPTNHLTGMRERIVVMALLAHVVDNKVKDRDPAYEIKDSPFLLVLDEAHNYLSEPSTAQERYIVGKYRKAARQGRKYKLGLFMVTQNPNDIDEEIRKQTNASILLGLEPEVIEEMRIPGGFDERLENFGKGEAIVKAPDVRAVEVKGLAVCLTKHSK